MNVWGVARLRAGFYLFLAMAFSGFVGCEDEASEITAPSFIDVLPATIDFGRAPISNSIRKEIIVRNTGQKTLNITGLKFRGDTNAFSLQTVPGAVPGNDKKGIILEFRPDEVGEFTASLTIESDADNNNAFEVMVRGEGIDNTLCGDCDSPPENVCITDFDLEVYDLVGECEAGECKYEKRVIPCEGRCAGGACVDNEVPLLSISLLPIPTYTTDEMVVTATATDLNGDEVTLSYEWFKNQSLVSAETTDKVAASKTSKGEEWMVTVTPNDGQVDGPKLSAWTTILNSKPVIGSVSVSPSTGNESTTFVCAPLNDSDADNDSINFTYQWSVNGQPSAFSPSIDGQLFDAGDEIVCTVTPNDGEEDGLPVSSTPIVIGNSAPSIASVVIGPANPNELSTITATVSGWMDDDGDTPVYRYQWFVNSVPTSTASRIDGGLFSRGDLIQLDVTPFDGVVEGPTVRSNQLTVGNAPPVVVSASLSPNPAYTTDTLTATVTGWFDADGDAPGYIFDWYVNRNLQSVSTNQYNDPLRRGDQVYVKVTPYDGIDRGLWVVSSTVTISNSVPSIASAWISPSSGNETTTFTCVPTGWNDADGDSPQYTYQWFVNSAPSVTTETISGMHFDRGNSIRCVATPTDGINSGTPQSSGTVTIGNTPPSISSVSITPGSGNEMTIFTCVPAGWNDADQDSPNYRYQWYVNSNASEQTETLDGSFFNYFDRIRCEVTPYDSFDDGLAVSSSTVTIQNSIPSVGSASLTPNPAFTDTSVTVIPSGWIDNDGDPETYVYEWFVDGMPVTSAITDTLDSGEFMRGQQVYARITPTDGTLGTPVSTATLTISNTIPSITSASINPGSGNENTTFNCVPGGWSDADMETEDYTYRWIINTQPSAVTTVSIDGNDFNRGDNLQCEVTPTDGIASGTPRTSGTVTVGNTAPTMVGVSITPGSGFEITQFTCVGAGFNDADGDGPNYDYQWYVNGAASVTGATIDGNSFDRDQDIRCDARANDQQGGVSAYVSSSTITIQNSLPTAPTATITPGNPTDADELNCAVLVASTDADPADEPITSYSYSWTNGTTSVAGQSVAANLVNTGDTWTCTITPNDGTADGAPGSVSVGPVRQSCVAGDGKGANCASTDCYTIMNDGFSTGDGLYWIDPDGTGPNAPYQVQCLMDTSYDGGGWTLVAVSSDDGQDTWTWNNRNYWDTDTTTFGSLNALNQDFKSPALHEVAARDLMFVHAPSGVWAAYPLSNPLGTLATTIDSTGGPITWSVAQGVEMRAGSLSASGSLQNTKLYFNSADQDSSADDHTWGPSFCTVANDNVPFDDPGIEASLGPHADLNENGGWAAPKDTEYSALGFGRALGLNTGTSGTGQNNMRVYVRNAPEVCSSLSFDGVDDFVEIAHSTSLGLVARDFTAEWWVRLDGNLNNTGAVISKRGTSALSGYTMATYQGELAASNGCCGGGSAMYFDDPRSDRFDSVSLGSSWHHVALTHDASADVSNFWLDGVDVGESTSWLSLGANTESVWLGREHVNAGEFTAMNLSGLRLSNVIRYTNDFSPAWPLLSDANTVALWDFSEQSGAILNDTSGNGHHGTINGAEWSTQCPIDADGDGFIANVDCDDSNPLITVCTEVCSLSITYPSANVSTNCSFTPSQAGVYRARRTNPQLSDGNRGGVVISGSGEYVSAGLYAGFQDEGHIGAGTTSPWPEHVVYMNAASGSGASNIFLELWTCGTVYWPLWDASSVNCTGTHEIIVDFIPGVQLDVSAANLIGSTSHSNPENFTTIETAGSTTMADGDLLFMEVNSCGNGGGSNNVFVDDTSRGVGQLDHGWPSNCSGANLYATELPPGTYTVRTRMFDSDTGNNIGTRNTSYYSGRLTQVP